MARKKAEIDTGKLLQALDSRHEELLHDLEDLNHQIELALSQLRVGDSQPAPVAPAAAMKQQAMIQPPAASKRAAKAKKSAKPSPVGK